MFQSLRFRLPALFLAGVVLAGIVSAAIAFQLLARATRRPLAEGAAPRGGRADDLYAQQAIKSSDEGGSRRRSSGRAREGDGDRIYYAGLPLFPGDRRLRRLRPG